MMQSGIRALEPILRRSVLLVVLYGLAAAIALSLASLMDDPDYGWHLRTGEWIVAHRAIPDVELFSSNSGGERWVAYSWAYDVLLCGLRAAFGSFAPVVLSVAMAISIAHALFTLLRRLSGRAALAAALTGAGIVAMGPMLYGRSTMFTILFAVLELRCLHRAVILGQRKALLFVPLVIAAWANVHVQFIHGLFLYACFFAQAVLDARAQTDDPHLRTERRRLVAWMAAIGAISLAATLANPYHVRIYEPLIIYLRQTPLIYQFIQELRPPDFTTIDSWMTLAIALLVVLVVLGTARRTLRRPFLLVAFAVAAYVAFRSARDAWFVVVTGLPIVALAFTRREESKESSEESSGHPLVVAVGTACVVVLAAVRLDVSKPSLAANLARNFPVGAAEFIDSEHLPGPMYNHYDWGGYLIWRLPRWKVSIDGRTWVHASEYIERSNRVWSARPGWQDDPELASAGFVVGARAMPLSAALAADPRFHLAYEDEVASVYVRNAR